MLLQQSIEHVPIVYTCYTYFVMHWSMLFIRAILGDVLILEYLKSDMFCIPLFPLHKSNHSSCQDQILPFVFILY